MNSEIKRLLLTNFVLGALVSLAALLYISQIQPAHVILSIAPPTSAELEAARMKLMYKIGGIGLLIGAFFVWVMLVARNTTPEEREAYWTSPEGKEHAKILILKFLNAFFAAILTVAGVSYLF